MQDNAAYISTGDEHTCFSNYACIEEKTDEIDDEGNTVVECVQIREIRRLLIADPRVLFTLDEPDAHDYRLEWFKDRHTLMAPLHNELIMYITNRRID